jgi:hypothetical protein
MEWTPCCPAITVIKIDDDWEIENKSELEFIQMQMNKQRIKQN